MSWLFKTDGRVTRVEYALLYLFIMVGVAVVALVSSFLPSMPLRTVATLIGATPFLIVAYCLSVRRAHDTGSGPALAGWLIASAYGLLGIAIATEGHRLFGSSFSAIDAVTTLSALFFLATSAYLLAVPSDEGCNEFGCPTEKA